MIVGETFFLNSRNQLFYSSMHNTTWINYCFMCSTLASWTGCTYKGGCSVFSDSKSHTCLNLCMLELFRCSWTINLGLTRSQHAMCTVIHLQSMNVSIFRMSAC